MILFNNKINLIYLFFVFLFIFILYRKFETSKLLVGKKLIILSSLSAVCVIFRVLFSSISFIRPTLAIIIIISSLISPLEAFMVSSISSIVSNTFLGQGLWTIYQIFAFGISGILSSVFLKKARSKLFLLVFGILNSILFCFIIDTSSFIIYSKYVSINLFINYFILSLPHDIILIISTCIFLLMFYEKSVIHIKNKFFNI